MQAIQDLGTRLESININRMIEGLFGTPKYQQLIPDYVRERLWEQGKYSTGKPIVTFNATDGRVYSVYTIFGTSEYKGKQDKGQPYDRVTLRDTGAFYSSFNLQPKQTYAVIAFNENKSDGKISDNVDLDNVFNLSEGELQDLRQEVLPDLVRLIKEKLLA